MKLIIVIFMVLVGVAQAYASKVRKAVSPNAMPDKSSEEFLGSVDDVSMSSEADESIINDNDADDYCENRNFSESMRNDAPTETESPSAYGWVENEVGLTSFNTKDAIIYQTILSNPYLQVEN